WTYKGTANIGLFTTGISSGTLSANGRSSFQTSNATFTVTPGTVYVVVLQATAGAFCTSSVPGVTTWAQAEFTDASLVSVTITYSPQPRGCGSFLLAILVAPRRRARPRSHPMGRNSELEFPSGATPGKRAAVREPSYLFHSKKRAPGAGCSQYASIGLNPRS